MNIFLKVIFFSPVERYAALIYKITTNPTTIDVARHQMFVKYNRDPHIIFSSSTALFQHNLSAAYIVDYVWNNSLVLLSDLLSPGECSCAVITKGYRPLWLRLSEAMKVVIQRIKGKFNPEKACADKWTCFKSDMMF